MVTASFAFVIATSHAGAAIILLLYRVKTKKIRRVNASDAVKGDFFRPSYMLDIIHPAPITVLKGGPEPQK